MLLIVLKNSNYNIKYILYKNNILYNKNSPKIWGESCGCFESNDDDDDN